MFKERTLLQVRSSGILNNKERIIFAKNGVLLFKYKSNIEGVLVLTNKRLLYLKKPSFFSMGYNFHKEFRIRNVLSVSIIGFFLKSLYIQMNDNSYIKFQCFHAIDFRNAILKERDKKSYKNEQNKYFCVWCKEPIHEKVFNFSKDKFGKPLCRKHQGTKFQKKLFFALKEKNIDCEYEYWDGHKHVDIAIHDANLLIEVDGKHHYLDPEQFSADLKRTEYSSKDGYITRHFSNRQIDDNLNEIVEAIAEAVNEKINLCN